MPTNNDIILDKVNQFISNKEMFTSVDISNGIKSDGTWIRNREVASFLRQYDFSNSSYERTMISVKGGQARANCYHPDYADPTNYTKTSQTTVKKAVVVSKPATLVTPSNIQANTKVYNRSVKDRFRVPKSIVEKVGLKAGDKVDITKIDDTMFNKISDKLIVTKDGRINIMVKSFKNATSNISTYENNGKIYFK